MRLRTLAVLVGGCALAAGEEIPAKADAAGKPAEVIAEPAETDVPEVEACIPDPVKALGAPAMLDFPGGIAMAVTAASAEVQAHVNQGLNHLHGGWEFEASRHFAAAMRADPECLLAEWGMVMALLTPNPETGPAQNAAARRMVFLLEQGKGSDLERGLAYALMKYIQEGPAGAASAFRKVADQFPNDMQASVFTALFGRGGYDVSGSATPDQEAAEKRLEDLVAKFPDSPVPLNALLTIRAEAPDLAKSLPLARKLCQMEPDYAPYFHVLGHYEWRCGNHTEAEAAFGKASSLYKAWEKSNGASVADCPGWVKSECYRIVSIASGGDFDTAYAAARQVADTPWPAERGASPGARLLLWEAKSLPARILLHRGLPGNAEEGLHSLPAPEVLVKTRADSLAYWWLDGLRFALEARRLLDSDKPEEARDAVAAFTLHGGEMAKTQQLAIRDGERSSWTRAFRALEVLASDLRGRMAMAGPADRIGAAYNWYSSAADRQRTEPMMFPPAVLTPMAVRLADYYLAAGNPEEAVAACERALAAFPNDSKSLEVLEKARKAAAVKK